MIYKSVIEYRKADYITSFSVFNANRTDPEIKKIKKDVYEMVSEINKNARGVDANTIHLEQFQEWYKKHNKPVEDAIKEFALLDLDKNGTAEKWEILRHRAKDLYIKHQKSAENEYNEIL